ncbi:hypothetical protein WS75_05470 [Burkholderia sp. FL-7-2-10-S1-D7]|nr:hypothetical protein WS75_05470 [Burkholderia sp. FL-7-2-10-S1-D7]
MREIVVAMRAQRRSRKMRDDDSGASVFSVEVGREVEAVDLIEAREGGGNARHRLYHAGYEWH